MLAQEEEMMMMIKGKRSKRPRPTSSLALFTMSTASTTTSTTSSPLNSDGEEEQVHHHQGHRDDDIEEDMANCLILLAKGQNPNKPIVASSSSSNPENISYQCKTCSKSFSSFQALGGHRASHKDRSSTSRDQENHRDHDYDRSVILSLQMSCNRVDLNGNTNDCKYGNVKKSSRVHECSICGAEFASGQALGGHMRRHRAVPPAAAGGGEPKRPRNLLALDLNLPAPEDRDRKVVFVPKEQVIAFSASSLVDCLY